MATRKSLTSRGYTTVQAGPSSTNRFLKPPRVVGEYTTVAEELRATKNAVGPAAQPLRPRARVEQQISEGEPIDTSYNATGRATVSTRGAEADLETNRGTRGAIDSFGGITKTAETITNQNRGIQAGLGFFSLAAPVLSPFTKALSGVAAVNTSNKISSLTDPMYGTNNQKSLFDKTVEEIEGIPAAINQMLSVPGNVVTGAQKGLNTLTSLVTKTEPVNQQRKSRVERAEQSTINKNTRDIAASVQAEQQSLQQAKEAQQQQTIKDNRRRDKEGGGGGGGFSGFGGSGEFSGNESLSEVST